LLVLVRLRALESVDMLLVMVSVEFSVALTVGAKVTVATQVAPAAADSGS
jgi:hypothetical protein